MTRVLALGAGDPFALVMDRLIRRSGGPGNLGRLQVHLADALERERVAAAWAALGRRWRPLSARLVAGLRGPRWQLAAAPPPLRLAAAASREPALDPRQGRLVRLSLDGPRLCLDWHHALCDARGAMGLLAALEDPTLEPWWREDYREAPGMPRSAAERGRLARSAVELLRPHRGRTLWRPPGSAAQSRAPMQSLHRSFGADGTRRLAERQRQATGRFGETPFLLAAVAAALEAIGGVGGDLLFPLAIDLRPAQAPRVLSNCHGFAFLRCAAGAASADLAATANDLKQQLAAWTRAEGERRMLCSLQYFPRLPLGLIRQQLGDQRPGLAASCLVANTGATRVPAQLFGCAVAGVDHAVAVPASPGLAVLFRRDVRGAGFDLCATGAVAQACDLTALAHAIEQQLFDRPLATTPSPVEAPCASR